MRMTKTGHTILGVGGETKLIFLDKFYQLNRLPPKQPHLFYQLSLTCHLYSQFEIPTNKVKVWRFDIVV